MHADGPRAVGPHGKPVEASAGTTASDVFVWELIKPIDGVEPPTFALQVRRSTTKLQGQRTRRGANACAELYEHDGSAKGTM